MTDSPLLAAACSPAGQHLTWSLMCGAAVCVVMCARDGRWRAAAVGLLLVMALEGWLSINWAADWALAHGARL